ncbi:MAG: TIGR01212 family radical SAM protein [Bacteroidetes bacterium HGW-Bacteroidetes-1]|nr:MAG: TIGR01212 family radical SAM protein [Bacteroidetes bacterium HGW-Bacteroidetes-1]
MVFPWGHKRRYNSYGEHFKGIFGGRVQKISVDAGFSCPNRDGTKGFGGCTFCNNDAFNPSYCQPQKPLQQQIEEGIEFHRKRYRRAKSFLVYFQAYSNTYKPLNELKMLYEEALRHPLVVGLVIGTRPDTIDEEKLIYLQNLQKNHYIMLEYGVESVSNKSLQRINRGHTFEEATMAIEMTANAGISCGAHFIFGLPGENRKQMLESAAIISKLPLTSVKFHQLQLFKNTVIADEYLENPEEFWLFTLEDYIDFIIELIEKLNPSFVIERFAGEVPPRFLVTPPWENIRYDVVLQRIEEELQKRNSWQGRLFNA